MKLLVLALVALSLPAQIRQPAANIRFGSALPATCTASIGQVFFLTSASAGANVYGCTATNTWTVQGSGVGGASNLTTVGAVPYVSASGVLSEAIGITSSTTANVAKIVIKAGSAQSSTNLQEWQNSSGTVLAAIQSAGEIIGPVGASTYLKSQASQNIVLYAPSGAINFQPGGSTQFVMNGGAFQLGSGADTSLSRVSAGVVGVGTGGAGSVAGTAVATRFSVGGTSASFPSIDNSSTTLRVRLADGSADAPLSASTGTFSGSVSASSFTASSDFAASSKSILRSATNGNWLLLNAAQTDFSLLQFGGTTSSFPALKRSSATLQVRLADDSDYATLTSGSVVSNGNVTTTAAYIFSGSSIISGAAVDGNIRLTNNAQSDFGRLQFGGTTSSFPSIKRSTTGLIARLADDSADTWVQASQFRSTLTTPASAAATCTAGTIVADTGFVYVCTATDTWKRVAIATW